MKITNVTANKKCTDILFHNKAIVNNTAAFQIHNPYGNFKAMAEIQTASLNMGHLKRFSVSKLSAIHNPHKNKNNTIFRIFSFWVATTLSWICFCILHLCRLHIVQNASGSIRHKNTPCIFWNDSCLCSWFLCRIRIWYLLYYTFFKCQEKV